MSFHTEDIAVDLSCVDRVYIAAGRRNPWHGVCNVPCLSYCETEYACHIYLLIYQGHHQIVTKKDGTQISYTFQVFTAQIMIFQLRRQLT